MMYEVLIVSTIDNMITGLALMIKCSKQDREIDKSSSCNSMKIMYRYFDSISDLNFVQNMKLPTTLLAKHFVKQREQICFSSN